MEKIKRLAPWDIFDLWETDAGKIGFADTWDRDTLRFTVHFHDDSSGFDHTSSAEIDGAFFMQMPRAEYKDWSRKAVHDPQYARTGLKDMEAVRSCLDMYTQPIRYVMDDLAADMGTFVGSHNAMEMLGNQVWLSFSKALETHLDPVGDSIWTWVPDALAMHHDVPAVKKVEAWFWRELTEYCKDGNLDDFLYADSRRYAARAGWKMREYIVSTLSEDEMENMVKSMRKIGATQQYYIDAEIKIQQLLFLDPDEIRSAWLSAQEDSDIFPGAGKIIDKFEVIPHG